MPRTSVALAILAALSLITACQPNAANSPAPSSEAAKASPPQRSGPAVSVTTVAAVQKDFPVALEATGTVSAISNVEIRPQITAVVRQVHVKEGQSVTRGTLLFTLDSRADEANVAKLRAQMQKDEAALADAQRQLARSQDLKARQFVSQGTVDTATTQVEAMSAAVAADRAALDAAQLNLSYAKITAPAAGRIGAIPVYAGSLVTANQTPMLSITQLDPVEVAFSLPQRYLADVIAAQQAGAIQVNAALPDQAPVAGRLSFVDSQVDAASGSVKLKARFDNPQAKLWPGAFAKVTMTVRTLKDAVLVPQASLIQNARGTLVYVVEEGKAQPKPVKVLHAEGAFAAVSGVAPGARIVLDGRQNVRPEAAVVEREPGAAQAEKSPAKGAAKSQEGKAP